MTDTLTRTSSMASHLSRIDKMLILHVPTSDASMATGVLVKKGVADMERGHRDPATLTEVAMTLGRVEALAEQRLPALNPVFGALRDARLTMLEMIRTADA